MYQNLKDNYHIWEYNLLKVIFKMVQLMVQGSINLQLNFTAPWSAQFIDLVNRQTKQLAPASLLGQFLIQKLQLFFIWGL